MTLRQACAKQLDRIPKNLPGAPDSDSDKKLYLGAFEKHARSESHAQRVIDSIVESAVFYPKIPELIEACEYISGDNLPTGCPICHGEPWISGTKKFKGREYDCAVRCSCERGKYLLARDRERQVA